MPTAAQSTPSQSASSSRLIWTGRVLSALPALLMLSGSLFGLLKPNAPAAVEGLVRLGYPVSLMQGLSLLELGCILLYLIPRTSLLGAVLLTGYLGGAVASHVRVGDPLFSQTLVPVYVSLLLWGGLFLREPRLRVLLPLRSSL